MAKQHEWHNVVHTQKVADHMNHLWGDFGHFDVPAAGTVRLTHEDNINPAPLMGYLMGYVAGLDENFGDVEGVLKIHNELTSKYAELRLLATEVVRVWNNLGYSWRWVDMSKLEKFLVMDEMYDVHD